MSQAIQALKKTSIVLMMAVAMIMVMATGAFAAEGDPVFDTAQVTSTFTSITTTVLVVIGAVAATAVTIMGVILAWKYGRKLFGMLAK